MRLPGGIYVLGKLWRVRLGKLKNEHGRCEDPPPLITIDAKQSVDNRRDALMHEITHAIDFDMGLKLSEIQVGRLATGWLTVLRANPELAKYLLAP